MSLIVTLKINQNSFMFYYLFDWENLFFFCYLKTQNDFIESRILCLFHVRNEVENLFRIILKEILFLFCVYISWARLLYNSMKNIFHSTSFFIWVYFITVYSLWFFCFFFCHAYLMKWKSSSRDCQLRLGTAFIYLCDCVNTKTYIDYYIFFIFFWHLLFQGEKNKCLKIIV